MSNYLNPITGLFAAFGLWIFTGFIIQEIYEWNKNPDTGFWTVSIIGVLGFICIFDSSVGSRIIGATAIIQAAIYYIPSTTTFPFHLHF